MSVCDWLKRPVLCCGIETLAESAEAVVSQPLLTNNKLMRRGLPRLLI